METIVHCPPINTVRLQPVRQTLNKICITVSDSGQVTLEVKSRGSKSCDDSQVEKTKEFIRISSDGMQIEVCNSAERVPSVDGCLSPSQPGQNYIYPDMPEKIWKKYQHAYKFVEVIRSVTPKVTLLTDRARCKLMENSPHANFQASFHDGVTLLFSQMKVTLTERDGSSLTFREDLASSHVSSDTLTLVDYSLQCRDQCLKVEKSVSSLQSRNSHQDFFPIVIGTNNQLYLPSLPQHKLPSVKPETGCKDTYHSSDLRGTFSNQGHIHQSQNNVLPGYNMCKQATGSEQSLKQIQKTINAFHCDILECPYPQENLYVLRDTSCSDRNLHMPCESSSFSNSPRGLERQTTCSKTEARDWLPGNSTSFEDLSSSSSNSTSHSASTTPQKSNQAASLQSDSSSRMHTDLSHDVVKHTILAKTANCEDQLSDWQDMVGHIIDAGLMNKFQSECQIPQNFHDSSLLPENSCNKYICAQGQLTFSPMCQTHLCDNSNTHFQPTQLTCDKNMSDSYATQFQNPFLTPHKSQAACHSHRYPYTGEVMRCRHKTPVRYDSHVDDRQLRNVKRNLFSDHTSEELNTSQLPTSPGNILMRGMINFSDCGISANVAYQNVELQAQAQTSSFDNVPLQTGVSEDSLSTSTTHSTPGKVPHITKSIVMYSQCSSRSADGQTESLALPLYSGTSSVQGSIQPSELSLSFSEDTNSRENSNIINTHLVAFAKPITQLQENRPFPENSISPRKSAPLRKVASLSPLKSASCNIQKNPAMEHTDQSGDFLPFKYPTSPVKSNRSSSSESSVINYQTVQSLENVSNIGKFSKPAFRSLPAMPLCRDFPTSSNNWNGLDLPFSRHVRHSLDVSSDGRSSSPPSSTSDVICQVFVPYMGWASLYATGTVWILYNDGTQLGVMSTEATVIYIGQDGSRARYNNTDVVPEVVKMKLEKVPKVIDLIKRSQATGFSGVQLWQS